MQILQIYRAETGAWYAVVQNDDGRTAEIKFRSRPSRDEAMDAVQAVFSPPTVAVIAEDGTTLQLAGVKAGTLNISPAQKTAVRNALQTVNTFVDAVLNVLPTDADQRSRLRERSPLLDGLFSIAERLR